MCGSVASENVFSQQSGIFKTHTLTQPSSTQVLIVFQNPTTAFMQQLLMLQLMLMQLQKIDSTQILERNL